MPLCGCVCSPLLPRAAAVMCMPSTTSRAATRVLASSRAGPHAGHSWDPSTAFMAAHCPRGQCFTVSRGAPGWRLGGAVSNGCSAWLHSTARAGRVHACALTSDGHAQHCAPDAISCERVAQVWRTAIFAKLLGANLSCRGGNWRGAAGSVGQSGGVFGESPPSNHVGWLMGATPPEMNGLYGSSPLYGGSGGSSGKRGGYLSSSPRGAHPSRFDSLRRCARALRFLRLGDMIGTLCMCLAQTGCSVGSMHTEWCARLLL